MNKTKTAAAILAAAAISTPAAAIMVDCNATAFTNLAATSCAGSFKGNINGDASEISFLDSHFHDSFIYLGKTDDSGSGPFASNPGEVTSGTLTFDTALSGSFVIGLKAAHYYSYYFFDATTPVTSLTFDTTAGASTNKKGIPRELSHAALYVGSVSAIPEPQTYALLLAGLGAVALVTPRRKA